MLKKLFSVVLLLSSLFIGTPGFSQALDIVQGEILIQLEDNQRPVAFIRNFEAQYGSKSKLTSFRKLNSPMDVWLFHFDHTEVAHTQLLRQLTNFPGLVVAQNNHLVNYRATVPDDPLFTSQWQWFSDGTIGTADADVDAELAWDISTGGLTPFGDEIVVAILDDGTDLDHPDLMANHWVNEGEVPDNGIDDDENGYVDDFNGWNIIDDNDNVDNGNHGVYVTGMVGAVGNNGIGVTGINWKVKNMMIKNNFLVEEVQVLEAYAYPYTMRKLYNETNGTKGAFVVASNASWGVNEGDPADSPLWCQFYDSLGVQGILNVGATTNFDVNVDLDGDLPTTCPSDFLVSVTRTTSSDMMDGAGYGPIHIDLTAPGSSIYSTGPNGEYGLNLGTSFSAPVVAGMIGLLYAAPCPNLTALAKSTPSEAALEARSLILDNVDVLAGFELLVATGGRANAYLPMLDITTNCGPCPGPRTLQVTDITTSSVLLNWLDDVNATSANLRYRVLNSSDWITETNVSLPYTLSGLSLCTEYEFQVQNECLDNMATSNYTPSALFKTDGCCEAPSNIVSIQPSAFSITMAWDQVTIATSYDIRYRPINSLDWEMINAVDTFIVIVDLAPCQDYEVEVRTNCPNTNTPFSSPILVSTEGCGACTENDYCTAGGNSSFEYIESVIINGQTNTSGNNEGYALFSSSPPTFDLLANYKIDVIIDYVNFSFDEVAFVYLDINANGLFEEGELLASNEGRDTIPLNIQIPGASMEGITRMRVVMGFKADSTDTCPIVDGEVEDYCVFINNPGLECEFIGPIDSLDSDVNNILLSWPAQNLALQYQFRWKNSLLTGWNAILVNDTFYDLRNLEKCTLYDFQVSSICFNGLSTFSPEQSFSTSCVSSTNNLDDAFEIVVSPNPFTSSIKIGFERFGEKQSTIRFINILGKSVLEFGTFDIQQGWNEIALDGLEILSPGVYFIEIADPTTRKVVQLLKI